MRERPLPTRLVSAALSAALVLSSFGPQAAVAAAQQLAAGAARSAAAVPALAPAAAAPLSPSMFAAPLSPAPAALAAPFAAALAPAAAPAPARAASAGPSAAASAVGALSEGVARPLSDPKTDSASLLGRVYDASPAAAPSAAIDSPAAEAAPAASAPARRAAPLPLARALHEAQISLKLSRPYEILVVNPDAPELRDPALYADLSNGAAKVATRSGHAARVLSEAADKGYQAVVLGRPAALVPAAGSKDAAALEAALRKLDSLRVLAERSIPRAAPFAPGSVDARAYAELAEAAERLRLAGRPAREAAELDGRIAALWGRIVSSDLKGAPLPDAASGLYGALRDHGTALLPFAPGEHAVLAWERLLARWQAADGGRFRAKRVDLEDGGHVLVLRKLEARAGLWLQPLAGRRVEASVLRANESAAGAAQARAALEAAGYGGELTRFDAAGLSVRHVFGADVGRQEIYVTVPAARAEEIARLVESRRETGADGANQGPRRAAGGPAAAPPAAPRAGGRIMWVDTGGRARKDVDVLDLVDEGSEDWAGHGTSVSDISLQDAAGASGTMAKVFSRESRLAVDAEIMAAAATALRLGHDVVSLSIGDRGTASQRLADFFSALTHRRNSAGEFPIVTAAAGNGGPVDGTLRQPAVGRDVLAVAAASASPVDGRPEIAHFSSAGRFADRRYAVTRWRLKPEIAGLGDEVSSTKSEDSPSGPGDTADGLKTVISGTSAANPALAAVMLTVKLAMKGSGAVTPFLEENLPFAVKAVVMRTAADLEAPVWFQGAGLADEWAALKLVFEEAGREFGTRWDHLRRAPSASGESWGWIRRLKSVEDAEDRAFRGTEVPVDDAAGSSSAAEERADEEPVEDAEAPRGYAPGRDALRAEAVRRFHAAREAEIPALIAALKDPVWLIRHRAAFALMNLRSPSAAAALAEAGVRDEDARVRAMAFLALAEIPKLPAEADDSLRKAAADPRWDVGVYAAYALARRGDSSAAARIVRETANSDKRARYAASWLAGQLGARATAAEAEALSARVKDRAERANIRHLAAAGLAHLADAAPESVSDRVVADLIDAADDAALGSALRAFFSAAVKDRDFVARARREPLKSLVVDFVLRNKSAAASRGGPAGLVELLAGAAAVPLDAPTPAPDPSGAGVAGVDAVLGPIDLLVTPPAGAPSAYADEGDPAGLARAFDAAGLDASLLNRHDVAARGALPVAGALWLSVPEAELYALTLALRQRGFAVRRALPEYPQARGDPGGAGLSLDLTDGQARAELPAGGDLSLVRVRADSGVSEARVTAALELVAARASGRGPALVVLTLGAPNAWGGELSGLLDRLVARGVGVVVGAGNEGPAPQAAGPKLAVVVAAGSREKGLQFYSARGGPDSALATWTDLVDHLDAGSSWADLALALTRGALASDAPGAAPLPALGTGAAAERTGEKLSRLAKVMADAFAARGRDLPPGWFLLLKSVVSSSVTPLPAYGAHEVGAGLYDEEGPALEALTRRLADLDGASREAADLDAAARASSESPAAAAAFPARRALTAALAATLGALPGRAAASALARGAVRAAAPGAAASSDGPSSWWKDSSATRAAVSVPLYALRREANDPGVGKFTDLGRYYRDVLAKQGVDAVLLLPHFAADGSPYAPVSPYALNEDNVDWSAVDEVRRDPALLARLNAPDPARRQAVDYADVRAREGGVAREAYAAFERDELARGTPRAAAYRDFLARGAAWLDDYAEFAALSARIGKPVLDWTPADVEAARRDRAFGPDREAHRFAQWQADLQLRAALAEIHAAGGKALFDVPMFRGKNSVDAWKRPEAFADLRTRNPGIVNARTHEDWKDLALWRWSKLKEDGYRLALEPFDHWLSFGFDGARADALHFAYQFGNGQLASGDEPGDDYVRALAGVFAKHGAFPLAEAFEGKDDDIRKFGFTTVGGDWKPVGSHDDPRRPDFLGRYFAARQEASSGAAAKFVGYALGDEWNDPLPLKSMRDGRSEWTYRIPLASDPDYAARAPQDARPQLRAMKAMKDGDEWSDPASVRAALGEAAKTFIKRDGGAVRLWAASRDWFMEEWGRDTFVSLPGLLLTAGRFDDAKAVIRRFAGFERDGLIPNRIADQPRAAREKAEGADYNSADAPMWLISAVQKTVAASGDWDFAREMAPVLRRIAARYREGTGYRRYRRFNRVFMDADGLIVSPAQATWMDADPDGQDRPVTPRDGKAVEINALWYANLRFLAELERRCGTEAAAREDDALADRVKASFNEKFWFTTEENRRAWGGAGGALRDVVEGDPHGDAIRPNMIFAVSSGGDLLSPERRRDVVLAATRDLLTRYGLRTLSPRDSQYRARYDTSLPPREKDQAYHQGTAWPWLMGAYADALARVRRDQGWSEERARAETRALMTPLIEALVSRPEGSLPEVFDGGAPEAALAGFSLDDPKGLDGAFSAAADQNPGGTRSQAWSVAETLRVLVERGLVPPGYSGSR